MGKLCSDIFMTACLLGLCFSLKKVMFNGLRSAVDPPEGVQYNVQLILVESFTTPIAQILLSWSPDRSKADKREKIVKYIKRKKEKKNKREILH